MLIIGSDFGQQLVLIIWRGRGVKEKTEMGIIHRYDIFQLTTHRFL